MNKYNMLLPILFSIMTVISCSKSISIDDTKYYVRFKSNDTLKEFTETTAYFLDPSQCSINGGTNDSTGNALTINLVTTGINPILSNSTYSESKITPAPENYVPNCYIAYAVNNPAFYNYVSWIAQVSEHEVYDCSVNILELDMQHVRGTFSGKVRELYGSSFIKITNGEFNVKRIF